MIALSVAVVMDGSIPTPHRISSSIWHSTYAAATGAAVQRPGAARAATPTMTSVSAKRRTSGGVTGSPAARDGEAEEELLVPAAVEDIVAARYGHRREELMAAGTGDGDAPGPDGRPR